MATIAASPTHNALGKAARRLLPLLFVLYVINFVLIGPTSRSQPWR